MIHPDQIIHSFSCLGSEFLKASLEQDVKMENKPSTRSLLAEAIENSCYYNPWFIPSFVRFAFTAWTEALSEYNLKKWIGKYLPGFIEKKPAVIGIIMAGNIPIVGLHDLLCILASGNHALIKLSKADDHLIPAVLKVLCDINPEFKNRFSITGGEPLKNFDAIIATGSNNSSRYFDYYFSKYPHIIRKNRNGIAVITGHEINDDLRKLGSDIFMYFGMGCRNVSKIYLPEGYSMKDVFPHFNDFSFLADMHKYRNNYDYQKSILLINRIPHLDNGFLLSKEDFSLASPISVIHTEVYHKMESLNEQLQNQKEQIQCIISSGKEVDHAILPGRSQFPQLWDYADGVDTMDFLMKL